eukprot:scaffold11355_cov59-Phaeocystis_antarctica.AAC.1
MKSVRSNGARSSATSLYRNGCERAESGRPVARCSAASSSSTSRSHTPTSSLRERTKPAVGRGVARAIGSAGAICRRSRCAESVASARAGSEWYARRRPSASEGRPPLQPAAPRRVARRAYAAAAARCRPTGRWRWRQARRPPTRARLSCLRRRVHRREIATTDGPLPSFSRVCTAAVVARSSVNNGGPRSQHGC